MQTKRIQKIVIVIFLCNKMKWNSRHNRSSKINDKLTLYKYVNNNIITYERKYLHSSEMLFDAGFKRWSISDFLRQHVPECYRLENKNYG